MRVRWRRNRMATPDSKNYENYEFCLFFDFIMLIPVGDEPMHSIR